MKRSQFTIFQKILFSLLGLSLIPVIIASLVAVHSINKVGQIAQVDMGEIGSQIHKSAEKARFYITKESIAQHNSKSTLAIETRTRDTAEQLASFLYSVDSIVLSIQAISVSPDSLLTFALAHNRLVTNPETLHWDDAQQKWVSAQRNEPATRLWQNEKNKTSWHYNPPLGYQKEWRPLFKEVTYLDLKGQEIVKIAGGVISSDLRDITNRHNTFAQAEHYFQYLDSLKEGELYVSSVVGVYQPFWGGKPGVFNPVVNKDKSPEMYGYAGRENPNGTRFGGVVRWVLPHYVKGKKVGYITCALDHRHLQEMIEHIYPTPETFTQHPDGGSGNYAFLWDNHSRSIVHPRHYFICGYDATTGDFVPGWTSGNKATQLAKGRIPLDCNTLDFAPQCQGWQNITELGGNGSFQIVWSGISKLTTVATVDYHTGANYHSARGFGYVTIGANVSDFHAPALKASETIEETISGQQVFVDHAVAVNKELIGSISAHNASIYVVLMLLSGFAVVVAAYYISQNITQPLQKISTAVLSMGKGKYQTIKSNCGGEVGDLVTAFNSMVIERQDVAEKLLENESRYRNLFETSPNGIIICYDKQVFDCNDETVNLFRAASKRQIIWKSPVELSPDIQPSGETSDVAIDAFLAAVFEDGFRKIDWLFKRMDGDEFYAEIWASSFVYQGKQMVHATIRDVTDKRKSEQEVQYAKLAAEEANQAKSIFLANMSHEVKTPMNGVMGMASILNKTKLDANQQRCVDLMTASAQRLLRTLNDILDFAQIESGKIGLSEHVFDVEAELRQAFEMLKVAAADKNIECNVSFQTEVPQYLYGDSSRITQIMLNLSMNSVKFTQSDGGINIVIGQYDLNSDDPMKFGLLLQVIDTGIGIPQEKQDVIFEPFAQAQASHTRKFEGSGLGLAITAELVALMNGHINVESREGIGTKFEVFLPISVVTNDDSKVQHEYALLDTTGNALHGKSVLLVESKLVNQMVIQEMLEGDGVILESVDMVSAFLLKIRTCTYDFILLDVELLDHDGDRMSRLIRDDSTMLNNTTPIIALSRQNSPEVKRTCLQSGMGGFVAKPVNKKILVQEMIRLLE